VLLLETVLPEYRSNSPNLVKDYSGKNGGREREREKKRECVGGEKTKRERRRENPDVTPGYA